VHWIKNLKEFIILKNGLEELKKKFKDLKHIFGMKLDFIVRIQYKNNYMKKETDEAPGIW
jgi:hypothetical protein